MAAAPEMLRVTEAAVVSGVGVREVNRALDEGILKGFPMGGEARLFSTGACAAITFYFGSAARLTVRERLSTIEGMGPRLMGLSARAFGASLKEDWTVRHGFLTIDMAPFLEATAGRLERLAAARAAVASSPDVLGGTPVVAGTRVPVHDVAASRAAGHALEAILAAYPTLTAEQVELATMYAEANPARGRPRALPLPEGTTIVSDRRVARRARA